MVTYQRVSLYFPSETNFADFNANAFIIFTFLSFPLVGNLSFSEGLRTSRNDNVTAFSTFILVFCIDLPNLPSCFYMKLQTAVRFGI